MTVLTTEQAVVTLVVTRGDGTGCTTRITDSKVTADPLARAASVASSLVRSRREATVAVTANDDDAATPAGRTRSPSSGRSRASDRGPTGSSAPPVGLTTSRARSSRTSPTRSPLARDAAACPPCRPPDRRRGVALARRYAGDMVQTSVTGAVLC